MPLSADLAQLAARVSNWGRWGADDQRGTLNLITPEVVRRGLAAARTGRTFSLALPFDQTGPQWDNVHMPERINPELRTHTVNVAFTGDTRDFTTSDDSFRMGSQAVTHWDAIAHVGYEGKLYNDTPDDVGECRRRRAGSASSTSDRWSPGGCCSTSRARTASTTSTTTTRSRATTSSGPRARPGWSWSRATRCSCAPATCTSCARGDKQRYSMPSPGLSTKSIEYLRDHDVAAVATDTMTFEVYPCEDPAIFMPVHMIQLRDIGLVQGQNWFLDDLAADCADDAQYDFLLVAPPLPLTGAVGAPVVPVAIK